MPSNNPFSRPVDFTKYAREVIKEVRVEFEGMKEECEGVVF